MTYLIRVDLAILIMGLIEKVDMETAACHDENYDEPREYYDEDEPTRFLCKRFKWTPKRRGKVLAAYFIGYAVTGFPAGFIIQRFGPKRVISLTLLIAAVFCTTIPVFVFTTWGVVVFIRMVIGFCSGVIYPALQHLVMAWAPRKERGRFMCSFLGGSLGTAISWSLLGTVDEHCWINGFLCTGGLVILLVCIFMYFVYDNPDEHPKISPEEKYYLEEVMPEMVPIGTRPPIWKILKSGPFWSLVFLHFGNTWGLFFTLTEDPTYVHTVLGFSLRKTGPLAGLILLSRVIGGLIFGFLADWMQSKNMFSVTILRKLFVIFSHFIPGGILLVLIYVSCQEELALFLSCVAMGFNGAALQTSLVNCHDINPKYASSVFGMVNSIGAIPGIAIPLMVGGITEWTNTLENWRKLYMIGGGIYIVSGLIFQVFGSGTPKCFGGNEKVVEEQVEEGYQY